MLEFLLKISSVLCKPRLLSPPRNPSCSPEMEEQKTLMSLSLSNGQSTSPESRVRALLTLVKVVLHCLLMTKVVCPRSGTRDGWVMGWYG